MVRYKNWSDKADYLIITNVSIIQKPYSFICLRPEHEKDNFFKSFYYEKKCKCQHIWINPMRQSSI